jgi:hypothetical protein
MNDFTEGEESILQKECYSSFHLGWIVYYLVKVIFFCSLSVLPYIV